MSNQKVLIQNPVLKFGRFYNNSSEYTKKYIEFIVCISRSLSKEIFVFMTSVFNRRSSKPNSAIEWYQPSKIISHSLNPKITWIGHSSFLIQINNINILTDPIFKSPSFLFPRIFKPGIDLSEMPKIDYVLISHNHWDHMSQQCLFDIKQRFPDVKFLLPKGDGYWLNKWGFDNFCEFEWWQQLKVNGLKFSFLPAHHWSQRSVFDQNKSLWGSWMIEGLSKIYFAGDTAYGQHFKEIGKNFAGIDYAIMPVGPCEPSKWMCKSHINSEDACKAFLELGAKQFIPMHWGTFYFGTDNFDTPIIRLQDWWQKNRESLRSKSLSILKIGQAIKS